MFLNRRHRHYLLDMWLLSPIEEVTAMEIVQALDVFHRLHRDFLVPLTLQMWQAAVTVPAEAKRCLLATTLPNRRLPLELVNILETTSY